MPTTREPGSEKSATIAGHSRVQSSLRLAVRNLRPLAGEAVLGEVQRPALVGGDRTPVTGHAAAASLLPATAADRQLLLAIEPFHQLVVHLPALAAQQLVQAAVAEPPPLAGKDAKTLA